MSEPMTEERQFPIQYYHRAEVEKRGPGPRTIPWSVAEKAYSAYSSRYGRSQTLEQLAERGGFSLCEMDMFYPKWQEEVSEIVRLRTELAAANAQTIEGVRGSLQARLEGRNEGGDIEIMRLVDAIVENETWGLAALCEKLKDAAEMLWVVIANVSGGDWQKQNADWQQAAARWRDNYFATIKATPASALAEVMAQVLEDAAAAIAAKGLDEGQRMQDWLRARAAALKEKP